MGNIRSKFRSSKSGQQVKQDLQRPEQVPDEEHQQTEEQDLAGRRSEDQDQTTESSRMAERDERENSQIKSDLQRPEQVGQEYQQTEEQALAGRRSENQDQTTGEEQQTLTIRRPDNQDQTTDILLRGPIIPEGLSHLKIGGSGDNPIINLTHCNIHIHHYEDASKLTSSHFHDCGRSLRNEGCCICFRF